MWRHNPTQRQNVAGGHQTSFPSPSKTSITVVQACHKNPDSASRPEGLKLVKGWEVLSQGPRCCLIIPFLLRRMERSVRLISRHDPDLAEFRTRGAIGPFHRLLQASTTGVMDRQSSERLPEPAGNTQEASADER